MTPVRLPVDAHHKEEIKAETKKLIQAFRKFDVDKSGKIDFGEMKNALASLEGLDSSDEGERHAPRHRLLLLFVAALIVESFDVEEWENGNSPALGFRRRAHGKARRRWRQRGQLGRVVR